MTNSSIYWIAQEIKLNDLCIINISNTSLDGFTQENHGGGKLKDEENFLSIGVFFVEKVSDFV